MLDAMNDNLVEDIPPTKLSTMEIEDSFQYWKETDRKTRI